jgi:hypothetical protein
LNSKVDIEAISDDDKQLNNFEGKVYDKKSGFHSDDIPNAGIDLEVEGVVLGVDDRVVFLAKVVGLFSGRQDSKQSD